MLFYFDKTVDAQEAGKRYLGVVCDKCGCKYYYCLARLGTGSATAPYMLGVAGAKRSAQEQAQRDLERQLAMEADLVPCPKCHWINEELIAGYRLGVFRSAGTLASAIAIVGMVVSLMCAGILARDNPVHRPTAILVLLVGPAVSIGLAVAIIALRSWWRSSIQPNQDFPLPPRLPFLSPPALVLDERTGELQPALQSVESPGRGDWHELPVGHALPAVCCECLRAVETAGVFSACDELKLPHCADCARATRRIRNWVWWCVLTASVAIAVVVLWLLQLDAVMFRLLLAAHFVVTLALASYAASLAASRRDPVKVHFIDPARNVIRMQFRNPLYQTVVQAALRSGGPLISPPTS